MPLPTSRRGGGGVTDTTRASEEEVEDQEGVLVTIDGHEVRAPEGELLIKTAEDNGTYIPRFCYHPRLKEVGMCRQCLVEIETPRGKMMVTACTNAVSDGMVVDTKSEAVHKAQEAILEYLLINHPLDCPVCDRGGECPLQDMTMSYGPGETRFVEEKRHFEKPIPVSDLVLLDRERCILCARCSRFAEEVPGDPLLTFKDRGYTTQISTFPNEPFSSYFSGNTVQICPVGALTATPYRFRARPWDLTKVESTCVHCTAGDRISVEASQNQVLRFIGVDVDATNRGWLSDKCRFGFEYLNSEDRLTNPLIRQEDGSFREASWGEATAVVAERLGAIKDAHGGDALAVLGGAHGTNEDAFALSVFAREVLGTKNIDSRMDDALGSRLLAGVERRARISDVDTAGVIVVWGPDLKEEHPTLYLRVRHAAQELGAKLVVIHPRATGLDDRADLKLTYRPGSGGDLLTQLRGGDHERFDELLGDGPVVGFVGRTGITESPDMAEAVIAWILEMDDSRVLPLARRGNTFGALDMGLAPDLDPGRVTAAEPGRDTASVLRGLASGDVRGLVMVGADPVRDVPDGALAASGLSGADFVVAIDMFQHDSTAHADVIFPALGFSEKEGTVTNIEGRVQKVNWVAPGAGQSRSDWSILTDIASAMGVDLGWTSAQEINDAIVKRVPAYSEASWDTLEWEEPDGVVVPAPTADVDHYRPQLKTQPTVGAEFVLHSARKLYDDGVMMRKGPSLARLTPGAAVHLHPDDARRLGARTGSAVRLVTKRGEVELPVQIDLSLHRGVVYVPFNQPGVAPLGEDPVVRASAISE
ncbi:MAG: NADH-quinone oxidoreductase subunit NuoG [Acidimicrobiia bacterium]|nr:NADH-quinone oxidoreductase subunit NuoG [Acidimicrobiia bacterium]